MKHNWIHNHKIEKMCYHNKLTLRGLSTKKPGREGINLRDNKDTENKPEWAGNLSEGWCISA